jgi:hypothetical protein
MVPLCFLHRHFLDGHFRWTFLDALLNGTFLEALINGTFFRQVIKPNILDLKKGQKMDCMYGLPLQVVNLCL